jgi:vancomycin resistance protein VanW
MPRTLFCQLGPWAYRLSVWKEQSLRRGRDALSEVRFAGEKDPRPLGVCVAKHSSLIRRRLGNVDMGLQENKAVNLALSAPMVSGVLLHPGETFSFWHLVGRPTAARGFREGLTISAGKPDRGIGGGMRQFTNLVHWMALHTCLTITEHHHHDGLDLFPDFNRQIPFGTGTSIYYNYLDYRLYNGTQAVYQLLVWVDGEYLRGEIRSDRPQRYKYHIRSEGEGFVRERGAVYRVGRIWREAIDPATGNRAERTLLRENHARVLYDTEGLKIKESEDQ